MSTLAAAYRDFRDGLTMFPIWHTLGWEQTMGRFRRTLLGPFWLASNMLGLAFALSFVFGGLFGVDWRSSLPFILLGILNWLITGAVLAEATSLFVLSGSLMQLQKLPLTFHVFQLMYRTAVNYVSQFIVAILVLAVLGLMRVPHWSFLLALPVVFITSFMMAIIVAIPSTRYRDVGHAILMVVQILFFCSPIFWSVSQMSPNRRFVVELNPLAHELAILRDPLLGQAPALYNWYWVLGTMGVSTVIAFVLLAMFRRRIVFWL